MYVLDIWIRPSVDLAPTSFKFSVPFTFFSLGLDTETCGLCWNRRARAHTHTMNYEIYIISIRLQFEIKFLSLLVVELWLFLGRVG